MMKPSDNNVENWIEEIHRNIMTAFCVMRRSVLGSSAEV